MNKKVLIIISIILAVILITIGTMSFIALSYDGIYKGVYTLDTNIGGMAKEDAKKVLESVIKDVNLCINLTALEGEMPVNMGDFGEISAEGTAESAYLVGRNNVFTKIYTYYTPFIKRTVNISGDFNKEQFNQALSEFNLTFTKCYVDNHFEIDGETLFIYTGSSGIMLDVDDTYNKIIEAISQNDGKVEATVLNQKYDGIDIEKIYKEVYTLPKNATANEETEEITPHIIGYDFDLQKAKETLSNVKENEVYEIPLTVTMPEITLDMLEIKFFKNTLASYTTYYSTSDTNRNTNISIAASKINNKVLQPGEIFSYNQTVGNRTANAGFKAAHVYVGNEIVDGIGGGICQVSSTLYNAVLYADLGVVSRTNHSMPVAYVPLGQDATVSWGTIDFKFKNTSAHPIKIEAVASGGVCTVTIKGKADEEFKVSISNVTTRVKPFGTEYKQDDSLEEGTEKIIKKGANGYTVKSTRTVTKNGKVVKTEALPASNYVPVSQIVARNEKKAEEEPKLPEETENPAEETPTDMPEELPEATPTDKPVTNTPEEYNGVKEQPFESTNEQFPTVETPEPQASVPSANAEFV